MGRGGGSTSGGGGGGGGGGIRLPDNPIVNGVCFAIAAVVFAVLTIAIPIYLVVSPAGDLCSPSESLNLKEQMWCVPPEDDLDETWETDPQYPKDVKVYYVKSADWTGKLTTRSQSYKPYSTYLNEGYDEFSLSCSYNLALDLDIHCTGSKCDKVKVYWLTNTQYLKSFDSDGNFVESANTPIHKGLNSDYHYVGVLTPPSTGAYFMHLIFSNHKEKGVTVTYTASVNYTVYDMSAFKAESCGECEFDDMKKGDVIVMEYLDGKHDYMDATIHNDDINWSAVFASAIILFVLTVICAILAVFYLWKVIKKGKKIAKKVEKKVEKEQKKQAEADAAAAAAAQPAYADPNYGQQPYPGQEAYAQQPYPGQM